MSTLATAALDSDEEDEDFVPETPKKRGARQTKGKAAVAGSKRTREGSAGSQSGSGSESDTEDEELELEQGESKRLRLEQEEAEEERRRKEAEENYKTLLHEKDEPPIATSASSAPKPLMVEVRRPRMFAGQLIYETVLLPQDDPETAKIVSEILNKATDEGHAATMSGGSTMTQEEADSANDKTRLDATAKGGTVPDNASTFNATAAASASVGVSASEAAPVSTASKPKAKGPVKRKPRQSLESMSAALDKGKKMTTLEKSAMDWKSHTSADASMQAELEANRRGGGYLEKQSFLDRVGERKTETFEKKKR